MQSSLGIAGRLECGDSGVEGSYTQMAESMLVPTDLAKVLIDSKGFRMRLDSSLSG